MRVSLILLLIPLFFRCSEFQQLQPKTDLATMPELEFVQIHGGEFIMGSGEDQSYSSGNEFPQHLVEVQAFQIMTTEVTQAQWKMIMPRNPSRFKYLGSERPVESVAWLDVQMFIARLNELDALYHYRLPSEAEWEYACRAGADHVFQTGSNPQDLDLHGWYEGNSGRSTHPVARKAPNEWGLYDMLGNVREWCEDTYHPDYWDAPLNGSAWVDENNTNRVTRGGSWFDYTGACTCMRRTKSREDDRRGDHIGFRLVREPK